MFSISHITEALRIDCRLLITSHPKFFFTIRCGFFSKPEYLNDVRRILGKMLTKSTWPDGKTKPKLPLVQRGKRLANGKTKLPYRGSDPFATVGDCDGMPSDGEDEPHLVGSNWRTCLNNCFYSFCLVIHGKSPFGCQCSCKKNRIVIHQICFQSEWRKQCLLLKMLMNKKYFYRPSTVGHQKASNKPSMFGTRNNRQIKLTAGKLRVGDKHTKWAFNLYYQSNRHNSSSGKSVHHW